MDPEPSWETLSHSWWDICGYDLLLLSVLKFSTFRKAEGVCVECSVMG